MAALSRYSFIPSTVSDMSYLSYTLSYALDTHCTCLNAKACFCFIVAAFASNAALLVSSLMRVEEADDALEHALEEVYAFVFDMFDTLSIGDNSSRSFAAMLLCFLAFASSLHHVCTL